MELLLDCSALRCPGQRGQRGCLMSGGLQGRSPVPATATAYGDAAPAWRLGCSLAAPLPPSGNGVVNATTTMQAGGAQRNSQKGSGVTKGGGGCSPPSLAAAAAVAGTSASAAVPFSSSRLGSLAEEAALETVRLSLSLAACDLAVLDAQREMDLSLKASAANPDPAAAGSGARAAGSRQRPPARKSPTLQQGASEDSENPGVMSTQLSGTPAPRALADPAVQVHQSATTRASSPLASPAAGGPPVPGPRLYELPRGQEDAAQRELEAALLADVLAVVDKARAVGRRGRSSLGEGGLQAGWGTPRGEDVSALEAALEEWACSGVVGREELSNVIKALGRRGQPQWALEVFYWMERQVQRPRQLQVQHLWQAEGDKEAGEALQEGQEAGEKEQAGVRGAVASSGQGIAVSRDQWGGPLSRSSSSSFSGHRAAGCLMHQRLRPNGHTFSLVLGILGRAGMVTEAEQVFETFRVMGFRDKVHGFNAMLAAYLRQGYTTKAWSLFEEMLHASRSAQEGSSEGVPSPGLEPAEPQVRDRGMPSAEASSRGLPMGDVVSKDGLNATDDNRAGRQELGFDKSPPPQGHRSGPRRKDGPSWLAPGPRELQAMEDHAEPEEDEVHVRRPKTVGVAWSRPSLLEAQDIPKVAEGSWVSASTPSSKAPARFDGLGKGQADLVPDSAVRIQQGGSSAPSPDIVTFNTMLGACGKGDRRRAVQGRPQGAADDARGLPVVSPSAAEVARTAGARSRGKGGAGADRALWMFHELRRRGLEANVRTYNALLVVLGREQRWHHVQSILGMMRAQPGVEPDMFTYNILISTNSKGQRLSEALTFYAEALARGLQPTVVTLSALMAGYASSGRTTEALAMFQQLERQERSQGLVPDSTAFCGLMAVYKDVGRADDVEATFRRMVAEGARPNTVAYSCLMHAYGREGRLEDASRVFEEMLGSSDSACSPDVQAFNILMAAYGQQGLSLHVARLFRRMQAQGLTPDTCTYNTLIQAFALAGQPRQAEQALQHMVSAHCKPDSVTRTLLLRAYDEAGWHAKANGLRRQPSQLARVTPLS